MALVVVFGANGDSARITAFSDEEPSTSLSGGSEAASPSEPDAAADSAGGGGAAGGATADPQAAAPAPAQRPKGAPAATAIAPSPPPPSPNAVAPARTRKVERNAVLALRTPDDEFERTTDAVIATVARFDGIVASSQIGASDAAGGEASFDLRIPTERLDRALAALSKLGHVTERNQSLQDITASFASAQERLADARAERRGLLRALGRATTQNQITALKAQLRSVSGRIAGSRASCPRCAAAPTCRASISPSAAAARAGAPAAADWTPGDAAGDALRVLEVVAGVALVALAVLAPLALIGGAVALGVRDGRRRRRESALDPA